MNHINQCYQILGLQPGASLEQVKQTYRDLAMVWHPDRFPNNSRLQEKAQEELKKINEAYEALISAQFISSTQTSTSSPHQPKSNNPKTYEQTNKTQNESVSDLISRLFPG